MADGISWSGEFIGIGGVIRRTKINGNISNLSSADSISPARSI